MIGKSKQMKAVESVRKVELARAREQLSDALDEEEKWNNKITSIDEEVARLLMISNKPQISLSVTCLESNSLARQITLDRLNALRNSRKEIELFLCTSKAETDREREVVALSARALLVVKKRLSRL